MTGRAKDEAVRRKLKSRAEELGLDFQTAVQYYAIERFLYRLSKTQWSDRLIVKGALMLRVWGGAVARPTRDIDFFGRTSGTPEAIREIIAECLSIDAGDGLVFSETIEVVPIQVADRYPGARAKVPGSLAGARFVLRLDVGIDDAAVPEPGWVDYPTLIDDPAPRILAYHPATAIAEKLQAMVELGTVNSRLKDYYDVWMLSRTLEFDGVELASALTATFTRRGTTLSGVTPVGLSDEFASNPASAQRWAVYRSRLAKAGVDAPEDLGCLVTEIAEFAMPVLQASAAEEDFGMMWAVESGWVEAQEQHA